MDRNIENILDTGGRNLSPADRQFVSTLFSELEQFQYQAPKDRALMFHPLGGYQRYLIHKVTEIFPKLTSFSIGDDQSRRTVVCFKSKRKEQQMRQMGTVSPERQQPRRRGSSFAPTPVGTMSNSKGRSKPTEPPPDAPTPKQHIPRPLRSKKAGKYSDSMPRSRSLHASPERQADRGHYYTDDDRQRSRKKDRGDNGSATSRRDLMRSSSMRDTRKSRSRQASPPDLITQPKSKTLPMSPSEISLKKRGHGLQLEGMVVNGDVEDPYNHDSEFEHARSDAEAIKREKSRRHRETKKKHKSRKSKSEPELPDLQRHQMDAKVYSADTMTDSDSPEEVLRRTVSSHSHRRKKPLKQVEPTNENRVKNKTRDQKQERSSSMPRTRSHPRNKLRSSSESDSSEGSEKIDTTDAHDELPPSYEISSALRSSTSVADRNLNRLKRADSLKSSGSASARKPFDNNVLDSSSPMDEPTHVETERNKKKKRSSAPNNIKQEMAERTNDKKSKSKKKNNATSKPQPSATGQYENVPERSPHTEEHVQVHRNPLVHKSDENLLASDATLYMPLPYNDVPLENEKVATEFPHNDHPLSTATSEYQPAETRMEPKSHNHASEKCDSEVQTEVSGTLSRKRDIINKKPTAEFKPESVKSSPLVSDSPMSESTPSRTTSTKLDSSGPSSSSTPSTLPNDKLMEEFCKVMLNFQKMFIATQNATNSEPAFPGQSYPPQMESFHPFAPYYSTQNNDSTPMAAMKLYNQFPPHIAHQLYLSWMAAYYAGATGSWPPPPVPNQTSAPKPPPIIPQYEIPPNFQKQAPPFSNSDHKKERSCYDHNEWNFPYRRQASSPVYGQNCDDNVCRYHSMLHESSTHNRNYPSPHSRTGPALEHFSMGDNRAEFSPPTDWKRVEKSNDHTSYSLPPRSYNTEPNDHPRSTPALLTDDVETDVSSVTSSSTHPEVALMKSKGGVMVYVRSGSQSNSIANSTISAGEDAVSLHSSSSHGLTLSTAALAASNAHSQSSYTDNDDTSHPDAPTEAAIVRREPTAKQSERQPKRKHSKSRSGRQLKESTLKSKNRNTPTAEEEYEGAKSETASSDMMGKRSSDHRKGD